MSAAQTNNTKSIAKKKLQPSFVTSWITLRKNFVIEIKPISWISWSCPDPIFFKNEYPNPILIRKNRKYHSGYPNLVLSMLTSARAVSGLNVDETKLSSTLTLRVELKQRKLNSEICWFELCSIKVTITSLTWSDLSIISKKALSCNSRGTFGFQNRAVEFERTRCNMLGNLHPQVTGIIIWQRPQIMRTFSAVITDVENKKILVKQ